MFDRNMFQLKPDQISTLKYNPNEIGVNEKYDLACCMSMYNIRLPRVEVSV